MLRFISIRIKLFRHVASLYVTISNNPITSFPPPPLSVENVSLQVEPVFDVNDTDTEDEEENERLCQELSHSPENSGLNLDNSEVCNPSIILNVMGIGCHENLVSVKEETGIYLDIKISIWNGIKYQYTNND